MLKGIFHSLSGYKTLKQRNAQSHNVGIRTTLLLADLFWGASFSVADADSIAAPPVVVMPFTFGCCDKCCICLTYVEIGSDGPEKVRVCARNGDCAGDEYWKFEWP